MKYYFGVILLGIILGSYLPADENHTIDLSGSWALSLENNNVTSPKPFQFNKTIELPGSIEQQNLGYPFSKKIKWIVYAPVNDWMININYEKYRKNENLKFPYWLQPTNWYQGIAWYQKEFTVESLDQNQYELFLERVHWESRVFLNGHYIGENQSLSTPHIFSLKNKLKKGKNKIQIAVNNNYIYSIGKNSHSISDHTQGNWNGIIGKIEIRKKPTILMQIKTACDNKRVSITTESNSTYRIPHWRIKCLISDLNGNIIKQQTLPYQNKLTFIFNNENEIKKWNEFNPQLYLVTLSLFEKGREETLITQKTIETGFRKITIDSKQKRIVINGKKIFLRGTVDCAIYPQTGYPPMRENEWASIFKKYKEFGLNHVRFHSWCPPEAAFNAADKAGLYLQIEGPSWANGDTTLGIGKASCFIQKAVIRTLKFYGHHPSFIMMAYGNEPGGAFQKCFLTRLLATMKQVNPEKIYTSAAGWPELPLNDYHNIPGPRIQGWGEGLNSIINKQPPSTQFNFVDKIKNLKVPVVSHEIGQWCAYPDFSEIKDYKGHLKPKNYEIFQDLLNSNIPGNWGEKFLIDSGKLQMLCYKSDIEAAVRTSGFGGYQLLGLQDFPGQGTATVGVLNALMKPKAYADSHYFRQFCSPIVALALFDKRNFFSNDSIPIQIQIANFYQEELDVTVNCLLETMDGKIVYRNRFNHHLLQGQLNDCTPVLINLASIKNKEKNNQSEYQIKITVSTLKQNNRSILNENSWPIFIYPIERKLKNSAQNMIQAFNSNSSHQKQVTTKSGLFNAINDPTVEVIIATLRPTEIKTPVKIGFSSIFWNTQWTGNQAPHTMGFHIETTHPLWKHFQTRSWQDWRWWHLTYQSSAMMIKNLPKQLVPLIMPIDTWFKARRLASLFEVKIEGKKLIVSSLNTENDEDPASLIFIKALQNYSLDENFNPEVEIDRNQLNSIF